MSHTDRENFRQGSAGAVPIFVLYLCVSFSLGISCANSGLNVLEAALMSALNMTSAGEFAAIGIISRGGSYAELALSQVVINLRYLLMSAALMIKLKPNETTGRKMLLATGVTDEIFGISVLRRDPLNPYYTFGALCTAMAGWVSGTALGVVLGNVLPGILVRSLSMAIYAMFIAIVLIPSRADMVLGAVVVASMAASWVCTKIFPGMEGGIRCIVLTVLVSALAAAVFPRKDG